MKMFVSSIIVLFVLFSGISEGFAQISFAILPIETKGEVSEETREIAESALYQNLIDTHRYKIIERGRLESILEEQSFQMTGAADETEAVEIGKILGVEKLIASRLYWKDENQPAISFSIINVATAEVELSRELSFANYRVDSLARFCASHIVREYPLLGDVIGEAKGIIVVGLGKNHGLKVGDRLFVARKEELVADDGEVLFQDLNRIGTLRVTKVGAARSTTQILSLTDEELRIAKHDLVSPEPIPKNDPFISIEPLLGNIEKGRLLLDDDMQSRKYLSPSYNNSDDYRDGKLHLDATHLTAGHCYAYYPTPFDRLDDFIMEGTVEFQPITEKYNKVSVAFRSRGDYTSSDNYNFYWNDEGSFAVYIWQLSNPFELVPLQATPTLNRGESVNTFRIVAYGSKVDCYINNEFVTAFEDETLEKGQIGFMAGSYSYMTIDDVKIWEAVKK